MANIRSGNAGGTPMWQMDTHTLGMDWLGDRLAGHDLEAGTVRYLRTGGAGPNAADTPTKRWWWED